MSNMISDWITWIDIYRADVPDEVVDELKTGPFQYTYKDMMGLREHLYSIELLEEQHPVEASPELIKWFELLKKQIDDKFIWDLAAATPAYFRIID